MYIDNIRAVIQTFPISQFFACGKNLSYIDLSLSHIYVYIHNTPQALFAHKNVEINRKKIFSWRRHYDSFT